MSPCLPTNPDPEFEVQRQSFAAAEKFFRRDVLPKARRDAAGSDLFSEKIEMLREASG